MSHVRVDRSSRDHRIRPKISQQSLTTDAHTLVNLLVNATPVGSLAREDASPLPDWVELPAAAVVFDLVYRPRRTRLLERAEAAGCVCVEGIEMLIEQGARSFEIWTGRPAPAEVMRQTAYRALDADVGAEVR